MCDALDEGKKMCDIISIGKDDYEFNMVAEDIEFLDILEKNIERVEQTENYELCARILHWINKLKEDGKSYAKSKNSKHKGAKYYAKKYRGQGK